MISQGEAQEGDLAQKEGGVGDRLIRDSVPDMEQNINILNDVIEAYCNFMNNRLRL